VTLPASIMPPAGRSELARVTLLVEGIVRAHVGAVEQAYSAAAPFVKDAVADVGEQFIGSVRNAVAAETERQRKQASVRGRVTGHEAQPVQHHVTEGWVLVAPIGRTGAGVNH
jgi:hypothetical protein